MSVERFLGCCAVERCLPLATRPSGLARTGRELTLFGERTVRELALFGDVRAPERICARIVRELALDRLGEGEGEDNGEGLL